MSMFTLAISCLTTSNLLWFMDLTFQVPLQYYSLQHQTLLPSPVTLTTGWYFCFGSVSSFFLELKRTNIQKRCPFHYRGLECKSRKSRNTWSNRQIWPWTIEWSRTKANRVLPRERTGHSKHPLPTTQKTLYTDITRWSILIDQSIQIDYILYRKMEKLYIVSKNKTRSCKWLRSWTPYCQIQY